MTTLTFLEYQWSLNLTAAKACIKQLMTAPHRNVCVYMALQAMSAISSGINMRAASMSFLGSRCMRNTVVKCGIDKYSSKNSSNMGIMLLVCVSESDCSLMAVDSVSILNSSHSGICTHVVLKRDIITKCIRSGCTKGNEETT